MIRILKQLFCIHAFEPAGMLYGDRINQFNGRRYIFRCVKCDHMQYRSRPESVNTKD